jgi:hypothetical protein
VNFLPVWAIALISVVYAALGAGFIAVLGAPLWACVVFAYLLFHASMISAQVSARDGQ